MSRIFFASLLFVMTLTGFGKVESTASAAPTLRPVRDDDRNQTGRRNLECGSNRPRSTAVAGVRG
jgi:hypothetical protein